MILIIFVSLLLVILYFIYKQIVNLINLVDSLFAVVSKNIDGVKQNSDTIINEVIEKYDETQAGGSFDPINIITSIIAPVLRLMQMLLIIQNKNKMKIYKF